MNKSKSDINPETIMTLAKTWKPKEVLKRGRVSILAQHIDTIRYLRGGRKMSYKSITQFFNENNVKVTYQTLMNFISANNIGGGKSKAKKKSV